MSANVRTEVKAGLDAAETGWETVPAGAVSGYHLNPSQHQPINSRRRLAIAGVRLRPAVSGADQRTVHVADGTTLAAGIVIWATGYRSDYSWIDIPDVISDDKVVHRRGVTDVPGLYFLGLPWQHTRGSALLGFIHDDAAYLAECITTHTQTNQSAAAQPTPPVTA